MEAEQSARATRTVSILSAGVHWSPGINKEPTDGSVKTRKFQDGFKEASTQQSLPSQIRARLPFFTAVAQPSPAAVGRFLGGRAEELIIQRDDSKPLKSSNIRVGGGALA